MDKNSYLSPNQLKSPETSELMNKRRLVIAHAKYAAYHTLLNTNPDFARRTLAAQAAVVVGETVQSTLTPEVAPINARETHATVVYDMEQERRLRAAHQDVDNVYMIQQKVGKDQNELAA